MTAITPALGCIKDTGTPKGRGVFAARRIASGELVEVCPVVVLSTRWNEMPQEVQRVVFDWGYLTNGSPASCLALGWGSMYNHGNPANVQYHAIADALCIHFRAARDIDAGEELTINYNETGGGTDSTDDVWFQDTGVAPIA